jgi:hypothetical protein
VQTLPPLKPPPVGTVFDEAAVKMDVWFTEMKLATAVSLLFAPP